MVDVEEDSGENPVLAWLSRTSRLNAQFLHQLALTDETLAVSLSGLYPASAGPARLRLALFMEYAAEQRLGPGEVAMLMGRASGLLDEALATLVSVASGMAARGGSLARKLQTVSVTRRRRAR
ncbi:MAG: hypothetical protein ACOYN0_07220 [Phycisphaerales bacterium]